MLVDEELATETLVKTSWKNNYRNNEHKTSSLSNKEVHAINR